MCVCRKKSECITSSFFNLGILLQLCNFNKNNTLLTSSNKIYIWKNKHEEGYFKRFNLFCNGDKLKGMYRGDEWD